jgi:hypothetical protein
MRTITLELLRHGPAHNQLLSPLTPYLALCENHGAETIHVPFEHNQLLHRLEALGYELGEESRLFQLRDTAAVMGEILGKIPGLTAEANRRGATGDTLTHLRLIISASELALLPFELALSPAGCPGAGQHLLLQSQTPVCLTREIRRSPDGEVRWPPRPRILFVAAAPPQVGEIPVQSHLLALRKIINPWVKYFDPGSREKRDQAVGEHLTFLPDASIETIEKQCATGKFTHVHILAHGIKRKEGQDTRFYVALHDARDPDEVDYVSGTRLAAALCAASEDSRRQLARPVVVTLASCDSGNVGSVAGAGASVAHALHEGGISMVVAGQFPLSFDGSVRLVEVLYQGLLWGDDPRPLIYDLRRRLYSQFRARHDWAALTVYASLPARFEQDLPDVQIERTVRSINAAMNHADEVTRRAYARIKRSKAPTGAEPDSQVFQGANERIRRDIKRLRTLLESFQDKKARIYGLLASSAKRQAEILFAASHKVELHAPADNLDNLNVKQEEYRTESNKLLIDARDCYWNSFILDRASHWAIVQYLSLDLVVRGIPELVNQASAAPDGISGGQGKEPKGLWQMAWLLSTYDLDTGTNQTRSWAHANLLELYMLSFLVPEIDPVTLNAEKQAFRHAERLIEIAGAESFEVYSTRRQIGRYLEWFDPLTNHQLGKVPALAETLFQILPESGEEHF